MCYDIIDKYAAESIAKTKWGMIQQQQKIPSDCIFSFRNSTCSTEMSSDAVEASCCLSSS